VFKLTCGTVRAPPTPRAADGGGYLNVHSRQ